MPNISAVTDCRKCYKWDKLTERFSKLAKRNAELEHQIILTTRIIEHQILADKKKLIIYNKHWKEVG